MRIALIVINALLIKFGVRPLKDALLYFAAGGTLMLVVVAYKAQKKLWQADMEAKQAEGE